MSQLLTFCLDDLLVLHDFPVEVLRDWLTAAFFYTLLLLVLRLVSVVVLWFALLFSCPLLALLLSCLQLALLFCLLLALLFSVLFILSPLLDDERCSASASSLRCSSRCPRTRIAPFSSFHHQLVGYGSVSDFSPLATWLWFLLYFSLTTGFLAVARSLILSRDTLWQVTSPWMPRLHLQHHYSALRPS